MKRFHFGMLASAATQLASAGTAMAQCPAGDILDGNGNCAPDTWVGDGYCAVDGSRLCFHRHDADVAFSYLVLSSARVNLFRSGEALALFQQAVSREPSRRKDRAPAP